MIMKLSLVATLLAGLVAKATSNADAAFDCDTQSECFHFTQTLVPGDACTGDWFYEICLHVDVNGENCPMLASSTVLHICEKDAQCHSEVSDFTVRTKKPGHGFYSCQNVKPGAYAEFLARDGSKTLRCSNGSGQNFQFGDVTASCDQYFHSEGVHCHATGGGQDGNQCMWKIQAPTWVPSEHPNSLTEPLCGVRTRVNFWDLPRGAYIRDQFIDSGVRFWNKSKSGTHYDTQVGKGPRVFDTGNPVGDTDLGSPSEGCCDTCGSNPGKLSGTSSKNQPDEGTTNCEPQGNVLITDGTGHSTNPNDAAGGGTIYFEFEHPVDLWALAFIDIDGYHQNEEVSITYMDSNGDGQSFVGQAGARQTGENGFTRFPWERGDGYDEMPMIGEDIMTVEIDWSSSGCVSYADFTMNCDEPVATCDEQVPCLKFTTSKSLTGADGATYCSGDCEYDVCVTLDFSQAGCPKDVSVGSFDYTCVWDDAGSTTCKETQDSFFDEIVGGQYVWTKMSTPGHNSKFCQRVPMGGQAEFVFKDGNSRFNYDGTGSDASGRCGSATKQFGPECTAKCSSINSSDQGCGSIPLNEGRDCVWTIDVPTTCNHNAGCGGDPHIKRWNRKRSTFHGECDLVMLHSDEFHDNAGLDLHIRTTIVDHYSYIESAALRVGEFVLEAYESGFYLGETFHTNEELPLSFGGKYTLYPYEIDTVSKWKGARIYRMDLGDDSHLLFKWYKHFLTVDVSGHANDFADSTGMIGNFYTGDMFSRDGTEMHDFDAYGLEWQVNESDLKLFRETREPQLPREQCRFPVEQRDSRRLRHGNPDLFEEAKLACSHHDEDDRELCIDDVMSVGDIGIASLW